MFHGASLRMRLFCRRRPESRRFVGPALVAGPCNVRRGMDLPKRETARLRFGRESASGATYFVTLCTKDRVPFLTQQETGNRVIGIIQAMHDSGDTTLLASTIMPDHVHLLFILGPRLQVGQIMGKFKTMARDRGRTSWRWQDDGFEHRIRNLESIEDYAFYIFMNPYRAGLCSLTKIWPWWVCPNPSPLNFLTKLASDHVVPLEWIGLREEIAHRIAVRP